MNYKSKIGFLLFLTIIALILIPDKLNFSFFKSNKLLTTSFILALSYLFLSKINLPQIFNKVYSSMNKFSKRPISRYSSKLQRFALKNGGELGGISNDGNTCFMNSVIQSLASSSELMKFMEDAKNSTFTLVLKSLLDDINGSYGSKGKEFSTKNLLNNMPNGPKQNFFTGYNQEDAQEFYQLIMSILEKEYHKEGSLSESEKSDVEAEKYVDSGDIDELITGTLSLGKLGKVYVPAYQVDPNILESDSRYMPLDLVTPVDGISTERIGCLTCGEGGGIRYSVISGLSLNLPSTQSMYSSLTLDDLLTNWITPEIIEDVNCNRCGLIQTRDFLLEKIKSIKNDLNNEKIINQYNIRIDLITNELKKNHIDDEVFEKISNKSMIKKSRKSKQIYLTRSPPLLAIHINRSVFDPRTYSIVKNPANVTFPAKLDLSPYTVEPQDINTDARKPFKKQDPREDEMDVEEVNEDNDTSNEIEEEKSILPENSALLYNLKAVIAHYGTHDYGHYICYRRLRGTWWRISDESVYVVTEKEVLSGQGTFMIFYEVDDGQEEVLEQLSEEESDEEDSPESSASSNRNFTISSELSAESVAELEIEQESNADDYNMAEERALHL